MWVTNKNLPSFWKLNYRWLKDGRLIFILILTQDKTRRCRRWNDVVCLLGLCPYSLFILIAYVRSTTRNFEEQGRPNHYVSEANEAWTFDVVINIMTYMFLDEKLNFGEHLNNFAEKVNKSIGLSRKLQFHGYFDWNKKIGNVRSNKKFES